MFKNPSLITRIAIGKVIGFIFGLICFITVPLIIPDITLMMRWAVLLWYTTVGAVIGVFGVFTYHPILKLPMPWWFRAPFIGAWMNFVLTLFVYDEFQRMMIVMFGESGVMTSPFWFLLEGAIVGLVIGFLATKFGGEGKETLDEVKNL